VAPGKFTTAVKVEKPCIACVGEEGAPREDGSYAGVNGAGGGGGWEVD